MGRPRGSRNAPGGEKPGRKPGQISIRKHIPQASDAEILDMKIKILSLYSSGECLTIAEAAERIGVSPARVYAWCRSDKDFHESFELSKEILADRLVAKLRDSGNFIPWMMLLKGLRPMYRDNFRGDDTNTKLQELLSALKDIKEKENKDAPTEKEVIELTDIEVVDK